MAAVLACDRAVLAWEICELRSSGWASLNAMSETRFEKDIMNSSAASWHSKQLSSLWCRCFRKVRVFWKKDRTLNMRYNEVHTPIIICGVLDSDRISRPLILLVTNTLLVTTTLPTSRHSEKPGQRVIVSAYHCTLEKWHS